MPLIAISGGAASATGRTAIGLRTTCPRLSVHVIDPKAHAPRVAVVRVTVTLKDLDWSGGTVILLSDTVAVNPGGACTVAWYWEAWSLLTLVTVLLTC